MSSKQPDSSHVGDDNDMKDSRPPFNPRWLIPRSPTVLMQLGFEHRWEVTRRHPIYLSFWERAARHLQSPSEDPTERSFAEAAILFLQVIGAGVPWPAPSSTAESILGTTVLGNSWIEGAVVPTTFRGLVGTLLADLPREGLREAGELLHEASKLPSDEKVLRYPLISRLNDLKNSVFNCLPNRPIVGLNLNAPSRIIQKSIETMIRELKQKHGIKETRRRDDKVDEYLEVWDLREGWSNDGGYEIAREQNLAEIAKKLRVPITTVLNRYRSAFRLIFGCDFSPNLWLEAFGGFKIMSLQAAGDRSTKSSRRPRKSRSRHPVTDSKLGREISGSAMVMDDLSGQLASDIVALIRRGRTNSEIIAESELTSPSAEQLVEHFRSRVSEGLFAWVED